MTIQETAISKLRQLPDPLAHLVNDFIDFLLGQWAKFPGQGQSENLQDANALVGQSEPSATGNFAEALQQFRSEALDCDLDPDEIFAEVRDQTPAPLEARW